MKELKKYFSTELRREINHEAHEFHLDIRAQTNKNQYRENGDKNFEEDPRNLINFSAQDFPNRIFQKFSINFS